MTLTIGRVSIVQNPSHLELAGDHLDVGGWFFGTDLNQAKVLREQLIGLDGNEDEPDVPVTWSFDAKVDGYYTVKAVAVSHIMGVAYEDFKFQYSVQLERVQGGFVLPLMEVAAALALRTNAVSVTSANGIVSAPATASFRAARFSNGEVAGMFTSAGNLRASATGSVVSTQFVTGVSSNLLSVTAAAEPSHYYDGSALIEQSIGGTFYPVVGDQIGYVAGNLLRIGNGIVRATFHTDGVITSEIFDGTVWESSTSFNLYANGVVDLWLPEGGWKIIRNDPAACAIRTSAQFGAAGSGNNMPASVTLYLERGKTLFELYVDNLFYAMHSAGDSDNSLQLRATAATAATALTGGIRQTSNNAQGHRWVLTSSSAVTNDLVNGRITIAAPGVPLIAQLGIGWELNGSAAVSRDTAASVATNYFAVTGLRQRVVAR